MPLPVYITVFQYPKCSTCKKALSWLEDHHLRFHTVDITQAPPSKEALRGYWKLSGERLESFFNTSGESYRAGNFKDRMLDLSHEQMLDALSADGKLIKRPLLVWAAPNSAPGEARVLVGFKEKAYEAMLVGGGR